MLIFQTAGRPEETYVDPKAIIAIEERGSESTLIHLSGGQTIGVDASPSRIVQTIQMAADQPDKSFKVKTHQ